MNKLRQNCIDTYKWSFHYTNTVINEYIRFINIKKDICDWDATFINPSPIINKIWSLHILNTISYVRMCNGDFVHHYPKGKYMNDKYNRAMRYAKTYVYLRLDGRPINYDIWPKPKFYMKLRNVITEVIKFNENTTLKWMHAYIKKKYNVKFEKDDLVLRGHILPFKTVNWYVVIDKKKKKRKRGYEKTKQIFIKCMDGLIITLSIPCEKTCGYDIKTMIHERTGIVEGVQRLIYSGTTINDVSDMCFLPEHTTLYLVFSERAC